MWGESLVITISGLFRFLVVKKKHVHHQKLPVIPQNWGQPFQNREIGHSFTSYYEQLIL
jgi:hypothetical protein